MDKLWCSGPRRRRSTSWIAVAAAWGGLGLLACGEESDPSEVNRPPDTQITATPPILEAAGSSVEFHWSGFDPDGYAAYYEWRISDNGPDAMVDLVDTLGLTWHATAASDSVFTVSADLDSFPADVDDPDQHPGDYRAWQTHTFFVRAVDDRGAVDPTPANISFTATTLAPTITIDVPPALTAHTCVSTNVAPTYRWTAEDPDGAEGSTSPPEAIRYLWWEPAECWSQARFEQVNPLAALPESAWSAWIPYDAALGTGRGVAFPGQEPGRNFFFAVQARDRAGAVTPTLEWGRNVRHVQIDGSLRPSLSVFEPSLGEFEVTTAQYAVAFDVIPGQQVDFEFAADASRYYGVIDGYRFGWDVADPTDPSDPGWTAGWGDQTRTGPRTLTGESHNLVVQTRDNAGSVVRAIFHFDVLPVPPRSNQHPVLLLKDWSAPTGIEPDALLFRMWDTRWQAFLAGVDGFDSARDFVNIRAQPDLFTFARISLYRSVIYFGKGADRVGTLHSLLAPTRVGLDAVLRYNWLEAYQATIGNLLFAGPAAMFATIEFDPPTWRYPIVFNVPGEFPPPRLPGGSTEIGGTLRYPYRAFCLESIDQVRPNGLVYGEVAGPGGQRRSVQCDAIARVVVDDGFLAEHPSAAGEVVDLVHDTERGLNWTANQGIYQWAREEFYNVNTSTRNVSLQLRPCQTVMYRMRARRDEGFVARPDTVCVPRNRPRSTLDLTPVGIASSAYADTKALTGSMDFVWGFHPLGFQPAQVASSLRWILREAWQLPVD